MPASGTAQGEDKDSATSGRSPMDHSWLLALNVRQSVPFGLAACPACPQGPVSWPHSQSVVPTHRL